MDRNPNAHIEEERLESYALNALGEEKAAIVEEHLLICETCQHRLDAMDRYTRAMQSAARRVREEESAVPGAITIGERLRGWMRVPVPIWAGAMVMAGVVLVLGVRVEERPGPSVDVRLEAVRGSSEGIAQPGHALHLLLDNRGMRQMPAWNIEIVNEAGSKVWHGTGSWSDTAITATANQSFKPGKYFVRVMKDRGHSEDPAREYQLIVQKHD